MTKPEPESADHVDDISDLTEEEQAFVIAARAEFDRIRQIPADQRSKLAPEKQVDPLGFAADGRKLVDPPHDDD